MSEFVTQFETEQGNKKYDFQSLGNFPTAEVGQFLKVTAVDENGNPTAWEMAEALNPDMSNLDETADLSWLAAMMGASKVVAGSYTGNAGDEIQTVYEQTINLGFTPKAVALLGKNYRYTSSATDHASNAIMATQEIPVTMNYGGHLLLEVVTNGFTVRSYIDTINSRYNVANSGVCYYIAIA